ncbi:MAG: nucleotide exchange factor GrpE [Clostridiales Family XIII bacterium]|jgi:molecular chaperone GrpE|nr:nucleotide exchange factor GrpE [Clostridiales Family XIII bacterium]
MTTNKPKPGGAPQRKSAQASVNGEAAGPEKEAGSAPGGARKDEGKEPHKARGARTPVDAEQAAEGGAGAPPPDDADRREATGDARQAEEADGRPEAPGDKAAQDEGPDAKYMRLAADFQNYKRRVEKEKSEIYAYANEKIAVDLLEVIDNFERALEAGGAEAKDEGFAKGMELIFKQLLDILSKNGVEEIQSLGEEFDPAMHHAVMMEETDDRESGKVSAVLSKGYRLKDRVIRPAMVKVAQ